MSAVTYPKSEVDSIITESVQTINELLGLTRKQAGEIEQLKAAVAKPTAEKVVLEKVAADGGTSAAPLDSTMVGKLLDQLVEQEYLKPEHRAKWASAISEEPNRITQLFSKIVDISALPESTGQGITKFASDKTKSAHTTLPDGWAEDGWADVVETGAN